jgi:hypothetical protein
MRRQLLWAVVLVLAGFDLASAQETTSGSIMGTVVDAQGASVPGATVTITSEQGPKALVTDSNGRFFAPYLTPGKYAVKVELTGFSPVEQKNITVRLGQRLELSFTLKVGGVQELVEVVGAAPVVDTNSTTTGGTLDSDVLKRLPVGRNFTDTLYLVPGVSDSSGVGQANPSISGASGLDNSYVIDGVNITNTGYGAIGSYSIVFGSLGNGVTTDFIKETQVKTGGYEAEYGSATGGVVNVVTQSGTNSFHGSAYGYFRPKGLESSWKKLQTPNGTVNTDNTEGYDFGATLGGPLVKDKVFFFGAINPQYQRRTVIAPVGFPLAGVNMGGPALGEATRKRRIISYAGKLTLQLSANHKFDLSAFGDPSHGDNGPQRGNALLARLDPASGLPGRFSSLDYGGHNQSVRYDGILNPNWLIEASFAHAKNSINEFPSVNTWATNDFRVKPTRRSGGIGYFENADGTNSQYSFKSTNIFSAGGNHQVRYGVSYEKVEYDSITQRTGPTFTLPNGVMTTTGGTVNIQPDPTYGQIYRVSRANYISLHATPQKYLSLFLQDTWQIGKKLTIRPGVRYEQQDLSGGPLNPLCYANDSVPGAGDGSGTLIPCHFKWDKNYAPRIGATFDILGNGKSKLFASFGRFYVRIPNDLAVRAMSADAGISRADYFDAALTRPVPTGTLALGTTNHFILAGTSAEAIQPDNAKLTYQQEFLGGVEFQVAKNVNLGVRYIHRTIPRVLEDSSNVPVGMCDLGTSIPSVPDPCTTNYFLQDIGVNSPRVPHFPGYPDASFENPVHTYNAIEVTANKTFSDNWSMVASYRWSKLEGNYEGFFRADNGQSDPAITSLFDFPTNDPGYSQIMVPQFGYGGDIRYQGCTLGCGLLPNDRTHQFKVYANYTFANLNLGFGLNAGSGKLLTGLWANPNYQNAGEIPDSVRGSGIKTVDGFTVRSPFEFRVDARVDYTIKFGSNQRVVVIADVFNLFNRQQPLDYDTWHDLGFQNANPNYGQPSNGGGSAFPGFASPRQVRVGARLEW